MQVIIEQNGDVLATIEVKLTKTDYEPEVNKALRDYQRRAAVPGFRQGKVPFGIVKKMYGQAILADQINKIVSDGLNDYIKSEELRVLGYPIPDADRTGTIDFDNSESFSFYFTVAMAPKVDVKLGELNIIYPKVKADAEEIDKTVQKLLEDYPEVTYPEKFENGDVLELRSTQADADGNEVEDGYQITAVLDSKEIVSEEMLNLLAGKELGSEFIFNFSKALGDREKVIKVLKFDTQNNELTESDFNVVIDEIRRTEASTLQESFFRRIFPNDELADEAAFRARVGQEIEKQLDAQSDFFVYSVALRKLVDDSTMKFDAGFMKQWLIDSSNGKISASELEESYPDYEKSIRYQLIEEDLVNKYPELRVSKEEVRQYVAGYFFGQMKMESTPEMEEMLSSTIDSILKNKKEEERIVRQLRENKMVKVFKENLRLTIEEVSSSEFKKLVENNSMLEKED